MPLLELLAQQAPDTLNWWESIFVPPTRIYRQVVDHPPVVAVPVFLGILAGLSVGIERVSAWIIRRFAARTTTTMDDVFVESLPRLVRTVLVFVALHVMAQALIQDPGLLESWIRVIRAFSVVFVGIALTGVGLRVTEAWVEGRPQMRPVGPGIKLALKVAVIPVLLVTVLQIFGIEIAAFLTVLGVGSLAVALALQDVLKNIFAGIQIVLDQPVRAGDFVLLDSGAVRGTVQEVGLRSTRLRTAEGNVVIVPNSTLANATVTNMDLTDRAVVHTVVVGVGYDADGRRAQEVLIDVATKVIADLESFVKEPPRVVLREFGDSALTFNVFVRVRQFSERFDAISELQLRIHERLRAEGIEIAFPTRTVYVRTETPKPAA